MKKKEKQHYVSNAEFYDVIVEFQNQRKLDPNCDIPYRFYQIVELMAKRIATHPFFSNYTWKDEMIDAAIFDCLRGIVMFKPEKTNNPFAYFTKTIRSAFFIVMKKEAREVEKKDIMLKNYEKNQKKQIDRHLFLEQKIEKDDYCGF